MKLQEITQEFGLSFDQSNGLSKEVWIAQKVKSKL